MRGATSFSTNSKIGCDNEFAIFVEIEEDKYLPNLAEYITFEKSSETKNIIRFNDENIFGTVDGILNIEIYYNPVTTDLVGCPDDADYYNIVTLKKER